MTDPNAPTDLGTITVIGQRRAPGGQFPTRGGGSGGPGEGGPEQEGYTEEDPAGHTIGPPVPQDPCTDPATALQWNADAAAAAAATALFAKAASLNDGSTLSNREFGLNLTRGNNTQVSPQPNVSVGSVPLPGQIPSVDLDMTGVTLGNWMGDIHNHPSGDGRLSDGEWTNFINFMSLISSTNPERLSELAHVSVYVVVVDTTSPKGYRIYAYTRDTPYDTLGAEVNPDAQPCSAV